VVGCGKYNNGLSSFIMEGGGVMFDPLLMKAAASSSYCSAMKRLAGY
jgi:hypothetical protein